MSPLPPNEDAQLSAALAAAAGLILALPEPLPNHPQDAAREDQIPVAGGGEGGDVRVDQIPAAAVVEGQGQGQGQDQGQDQGPGGEGEAGLPFEPELEPGAAEAAATPTPTPTPKPTPKPKPKPKGPKVKKPRVKKLPLPPHEALLFAPRGIYVDVGETGRLRCSCNHKPCDRWELYGYTRHFGFKCHRRYEEERLDDEEIRRLREAKEAYLRLHPAAEETSIRRKRRMREGEKALGADELRVQERHWMAMWKDAKNELRQIRQELKGEVDEEVRAELMADIQGLKRRKGDWAQLLGLNEGQGFTVNL